MRCLGGRERGREKRERRCRRLKTKKSDSLKRERTGKSHFFFAVGTELRRKAFALSTSTPPKTMPWFTPVRSGATAAAVAPDEASAPTINITAEEWDKAGKGSSIATPIPPTSTLPSKPPSFRVAPPARAPGADVLFSAASAGDADAVRVSFSTRKPREETRIACSFFLLSFV